MQSLVASSHPRRVTFEGSCIEVHLYTAQLRKRSVEVRAGGRRRRWHRGHCHQHSSVRPQGDKTAQWRMGSVAGEGPTELELHACACGICARTRAQSVSKRARTRTFMCVCVCVCVCSTFAQLVASYMLNVFIGSHKEKTAASCQSANQPSLPFSAMPEPLTASSFCKLISPREFSWFESRMGR